MDEAVRNKAAPPQAGQRGAAASNQL